MRSRNIPTRAIAHILDSKWAIREDRLDMIMQIAYRENDLSAMEALADRLPAGRVTDDGDVLFVREGGVAIIDIVGPMFRYANLMTWYCGASSYEERARAFTAAIQDDTITAIILNCDTPGGEVTGCSEFAAMVRAGCEVKPVIAYVDGDCCSAGYWIASACDHIVVSSTSVVGCLGVVGLWSDRSGADKLEGVKKYEIVSSLTPNKRPDPATEDGRSQLLRMLDALAAVFLEDVGANRGIEGGAKAVAKQFGAGDVFVGQYAVDAGLADEVGSFEGLLATLQPAPPTPRKKAA